MLCQVPTANPTVGWLGLALPESQKAQRLTTDPCAFRLCCVCAVCMDVTYSAIVCGVVQQHLSYWAVAAGR